MQDDNDISQALTVAGRELSSLGGSREIDFVTIEKATWPDASLGWPEAGTSYAQVLMPGFRIVAKLAGKTFECRVSGDLARCRMLD